MRHWLPSAAALLSAFWTLSATALGLGEMSVESGLNQRFVARIPLTLTATDDASAVRVALASNAEFERAGLERPAFLSDLRFDVVTDGNPHVRVTSNQIAREPIVMLLVEVRDTSSRVLREYTVFLDPPYFGPGTPAEVSTPVPVAAAPLTTPPPTPVSTPVAAVAATPLPTPAPIAATPAPATVQPTSSQFYETVEESGRTTQSSPDATPVAESAATVAAPSATDYGPVAAGQTLWSIATEVRPDASVTMDQMLLALYRGNPSAFEGGINGLLKGAVLRVPSLDEIAAVDADAARLEVRRLRGLDRPAPTRSPKPTPAPSLKPTPAPTQAAEPKPTSGPISLPAQPTATPAPQPTTSPAELSPGLPIVEPSVPASEDVVVDTQTTVADTEQGVAADDGAVTEATANPEPSSTPAPAAAATEQDEIVSGPRPKRESGLLETLLIPLILGLLVLGGIGYLISRILARRKAGAEPSAKVSRGVPKPSLTPKPVAAAAVATPAAAELEPEPAAAATQQAETQQFELPQAPAADTGAAMGTTQTVKAPPPAEPEPVDFDLTGQFESQTMQIDLDTNDPVSEADFHLAYGLYDEAALLLKQAAEREPGRSEIRTKLAETYFAAGKPDEFIAAAEAAHPLVSAADWQKIAIMGQQLCPDAELFHEAAAVADVDSMDFDLGALGEAEGDVDATATAGEPGPASAVTSGDGNTDSGGLDFKLDEFDLPAVDQPTLTESPSAHANALEFDLSQFDLSQPGEDTEAVPPSDAAPTPAENAVDFELDLSAFDTAGETPADVPAATPGDGDAATSVGMPELAQEPAVQGEATTSGDAAVSTDARDVESAIDFQLDTPEDETVATEPEIRLDDIDLGEMPTESAAAGDEVGTKLDLARAYVDMGDNEMARSLLDEVVEQGNAQQKQDAQDLLTRLG
jgi:pilus assembly protein FimV